MRLPPLEPAFQGHLQNIADTKVVQNDQLWNSEILPLFLHRLDRLADTTAEDEQTNKKTINIKSHVEKNFSGGPPFTIYRLAELLLETEIIGRQALPRYIDAISRAAMVLSMEGEYGEKDDDMENGVNGGVNGDKGDSPQAQEEDYVAHELPTNVRFIKLPWVTEAKVSDFDMEESINAMDQHWHHERTPPLKRQKTTTEEPSQLLSPLMSKQAPEDTSGASQIHTNTPRDGQ